MHLGSQLVISYRVREVQETHLGLTTLISPVYLIPQGIDPVQLHERCNKFMGGPRLFLKRCGKGGAVVGRYALGKTEQILRQ